jgi:hypothetical protein
LGYFVAVQRYESAVARETLQNLGLAIRLDEHIATGNRSDAQLILDGLVVGYVARMIELDNAPLDDGAQRLKGLTLTLLKRRWDTRVPMAQATESLKSVVDWSTDWPRYKAYVDAAHDRYAGKIDHPSTNTR